MTISLSARRAFMLAAPEFIPEGLGLIFDHGLRIVRSLECDLAMGLCAFEIEGAALPPECGEPGPLREVSLHFTKETYGRQSMVRVSAIKVTGRNLGEVLPVATGDDLGFSIRRLQVKPGDTLVVRTEHRVSKELCDRITEVVTASLSDDVAGSVRVLVLDAGMSLELLGKAA